jgi:hypothetical protein
MAARMWCVPLTAMLLLGGVALVRAGELYQWKDARGVTHYADAPPPKGQFRSRNLQVGEGVPAALPATAKPGSAAHANCTVAQANLQRLASGGNVGLDANGDGKPDAVMDAAEQARQRDLAQRQIGLFCTAGAAASRP